MIFDKINDASTEALPVIFGVHQEDMSHELIWLNNSQMVLFVVSTVVKRERQLFLPMI
jgi:hypothetical protein